MTVSNSDEFITFGPTHLITLGLIFFVSFILVLIARHERGKKWITPISFGLAILLIGNELLYIIILLATGRWTPTWGLPLQLCDVAIFAVALSLVRYRPVIWEIAYFWGLSATGQALLTPDLRMNFPDYIYIKFFLTHGLIVIGVIFLAAGLGRPIFFSSVRRVFIVTNVYAGFIGLFNWVFKSNYLYLCHKPSQPSLIDWMGPWPVYFIGLEAVLVLSLLFYYLPYYMFHRMKG